MENKSQQVVKSTREQALEWWKGLPNNYAGNSKGGLAFKYGFRDKKSHSGLTDNEIEDIWKKENPIAALPDEAINTNFEGIEQEHIDFADMEMRVAMYTAEEAEINKYNQKQFKQFDAKLFKAYINKFSDEDKIKMHQILFTSFDHKTRNKIIEAIVN